MNYKYKMNRFDFFSSFLSSSFLRRKFRVNLHFLVFCTFVNLHFFVCVYIHKALIFLLGA